ncbi:hypothetical protein AGR13a_Cc260068 [Agrobacterium genomosp. 13 str. CFBP 6927]|uniref:Uncharacterized protein n=1 Tax=Agrobacterium genomosp. 13 str. CFBP 6927 TaxID=1183428 RepID=A0ABM9VEY2_9HYPH|nr:hypothetical protein AGR13a_Cc260068 [Agrobacterium genomosp. 13 str. CFBP 6927]
MAIAVTFFSGKARAAAGSIISLVQRDSARAVSQRMVPDGSSLMPGRTTESSIGASMPQPCSSSRIGSSCLNSAPISFKAPRQACSAAGSSGFTGSACFSSGFAASSAGFWRSPSLSSLRSPSFFAPSEPFPAGNSLPSGCCSFGISGFGAGFGASAGFCVSSSIGFSAPAGAFPSTGFGCGTGTCGGGSEAEINVRLITKRHRR